MILYYMNLYYIMLYYIMLHVLDVGKQMADGKHQTCVLSLCAQQY